MANPYKKFGDTWKDAPYHETGVKFVIRDMGGEAGRELLPLSREALDAGESNYLSRANNVINTLMRLVHDEYMSGAITKADLRAKGKGDPAGRLVKRHPEVFAENGIDLSTTKMQLAQKALQVLLSYVNRNEKAGKVRRQTPKVRNSRSIPFRVGAAKDMTPGDMEGELRFSLGKGKEKRVACNYLVPNRFKARKKLLAGKATFGGNLVRRGGCSYFVAQVREPFKWAYEPESALGLDINKQAKWFVVLSDRQVVQQPKAMTDLVKAIRGLNKSISATQKSGKKLCEDRRSWGAGKGAGKKIRNGRRKLRLAWKAAHRDLEDMVRPFAEAIVDAAEGRRALVCIDNVKTGQKNGTWGQDKLVSLLVAECEARRIPYVLVPPHYTSLFHSECCAVGSRKRKPDGRIDMNTCVCPNCGDYDSHHNAALNVAKFGRMIWNEGHEEFAEWIKEKKAAVTV